MNAELPPLTYLSFDSLAEGVGASQVVAYVEGLARRGVDVSLHSFEKSDPSPAVGRRLAACGARWKPHRFGGTGPRGGLARVARAATALRGAELVHARSDLAAASALLARPRSWVWDMRSFWVDERIELGMVRSGSPEERALRLVERRAARSAGAIVTLAATAVPVIADRHGRTAACKARVITTCVDLDRFALSSPPPSAPRRVLLSGTLNARYDVAAMVGFVEALRRRRAVDLEVLSPDPGRWTALLEGAGAKLGRLSPAEMPNRVAAVHAGLCLLQRGATPANQAMMPTKVGEFLASGRPVVVSAGLGDLDALVARFDCGVVVDDLSDVGIERASEDLDRLIDDPGTPRRCRALAEEHFSLERGVDALISTYHAALAATNARGPGWRPRPPEPVKARAALRGWREP